MWRIKCSNGKYVDKTTYGTWVTYTKNGKIFTSENLAKKNLYLCEDFVENSKQEEYKNLTYELEKINQYYEDKRFRQKTYRAPT